MDKPKGLSIIFEIGEWHWGIAFSKVHSYISLGWVSLHLFTFAYMEQNDKVHEKMTMALIGAALQSFDEDGIL